MQEIEVDWEKNSHDQNVKIYSDLYNGKQLTDFQLQIMITLHEDLIKGLDVFGALHQLTRSDIYKKLDGLKKIRAIRRREGQWSLEG